MRSSDEQRFVAGRVLVLVDDITTQDTVAIVNAANSTLLGGGGVDGAIHRAGGSEILRACRKIRAEAYPEGLPTGNAVLTTGGNLRSRYVIHTVGPIYGRENNEEAQLLASCYKNSLQLALAHDIASIAFPSISTGAFGYPREEAAKVASLAINEFLAVNSTPSEVRLIFFQPSDAGVFLRYHKFE